MGASHMNRLVILDQLRGFAALYVACSHVILHRLPMDSFWARFPWAFGQEAVVIFFVISGLAIKLSIEARGDQVGRSFLQRRFTRLFPMIFLGLLFGYGCASIEYGDWRPLRGAELLGNMLFFQDFAPVKPGTLCNTYYGNATLWSLSYEWWFYVQCAVIWRFVSPQRRTDAAGFISLSAISVLIFLPNAVSYWVGYFILWWAGTTFLNPKSRDCKRAMIWVWLTTLMAIAVVLSDRGGGDILQRPGVFPMLVARHFCFIALFLTVIFVCVQKSWGGFFLRVRGFAWIAPYSYALYVLHYPLASDASWLRAMGLETGITAFLVYGSAVVIAVWWAVHKYEPWAQRILNNRFKKLSSRP